MKIRLLHMYIAMLIAANTLSAAENTVSYNEVRPIFRKHCLACHNANQARGGFDMSNFNTLMAGGSSGKVILAGKPKESLLYALTAHTEEPAMPPNSPRIPTKDLETLAKWIEAGAPEKIKTSTTSNRSPATIAGFVPITPLPRACPTTALAVSPTADWVAASGQEQALLFDRKLGKFAKAIPFPEGVIHDLQFSNDGKVLVMAGGQDAQRGVVVGVQIETGERLFELGDDTDVYLTCAMSADQKWLVMGGPTRTVTLYSIPEKKIVHSWQKPTDWVTQVSFSPDGLLVAAGDRFGAVLVWETESGKEFATFRGHTQAITGIAWHPSGDEFATVAEDGTLRRWDMHKISASDHWIAHPGGATAVSYANAEQVISVGRDRTVKTWSLAGKSLGTSEVAEEEFLELSLIAKDSQVVTANFAGSIQFWTKDHALKKSIPIPVEAKVIESALVQPATPPNLPTNVAIVPKTVVTAGSLATDTLEEARLAAQQAFAELQQAEVDYQLAKKNLARRAAESAIAQLKVAVQADPANALLKEALAKAELAIQEK